MTPAEFRQHVRWLTMSVLLGAAGTGVTQCGIPVVGGAMLGAAFMIALGFRITIGKAMP